MYRKLLEHQKKLLICEKWEWELSTFVFHLLCAALAFGHEPFLFIFWQYHLSHSFSPFLPWLFLR
jgi:hypothetical protein